MSVNVTGAYIYFTIPIFGGINITQTTLSVLLVSLILGITGVLIGRKLTIRPDKKQALVERGILMMRNMVVDTMGAHNAHWTPYICTIFLSSICGSFIGLTGIFRSSTADLSVTLTWSIMTTAIIWYHNIKNSGFVAWLKGFTEPVVVMTPMNIISEIAQPISMAFRHFGNVAGGGVITSIIYAGLALGSNVLMRAISGTIVVPIIMAVLGAGLVVWGKKKNKKFRLIVGIVFIVLGVLGALQNLGVLAGINILQFGIPAVLSVYFDLFSGFVQAFVFSLLNMVYIAGACPPPEESK